MVLTLPNVKAIQCGGLSGDVMQRLAAMLNFLSSWKQQGCFQVHRITMSTFPAQKMLPFDTNRWHHILLSICVIKLKQDWNVFFFCLFFFFEPLNSHFIRYDTGMSKTLLCVPNHIRHHNHRLCNRVGTLGELSTSENQNTSIAPWWWAALKVINPSVISGRASAKLKTQSTGQIDVFKVAAISWVLFSYLMICRWTPEMGVETSISFTVDDHNIEP